MPNYVRPFVPGGTFFFTVVTQDREEVFRDPLARRLLREAIAAVRRDRPFDLIAVVLMPEHLHAMWELPPGDADFSSRWAAIKARFTRAYLAMGGTERAVTDDRARHHGRGVWQPRFYDHWVRNEEDYARHLDYLHYNPVKHRHALCPHAWPHSTFEKWVKQAVYELDWLCTCDGRLVRPPDFSELPKEIE